MAEVNQLCEQFESAWVAGERPRAESYLTRVGDDLRYPLLCELLRLEFELRHAAGEDVTEQEFHDRFPGDRTAVEEALRATRSWAPGPGAAGGAGRVGKYDIIRPLGSGGQGQTLLAFDPDLKRQVVLKVYYGTGTPVQQGQVLNEGRALARVQSPYVARCLSAERDGDQVWLVMEFIPGRTLAALLRERVLGIGEVVRLVRQIAEGLSAVHAAGLLHRDLKPSNVLIGDDGVPRLIDFGLAAPLASDALHGISGTLSYMAPEQARGQGEQVDVRTDVFGLGAVLYELLTARPPYHDPDPIRLIELARRAQITPPRDVRPSVPRALERVCLKAMAPVPSRRYPGAAEMQRALDVVASRRLRSVVLLAAAGLVTLGVMNWAVRAHRRPAAAPVTVPAAALAPAPARDAPAAPVPTPAPAPAAPALTGELLVQVWSPEGKGRKQGRLVGEPETLPVFNGERVHLQARLNRPAYVYLLWVGSGGNVLPLYPWTQPRLGFASPRPEPVAEATVHCPARLDEGWPMKGASGLETALLLARETPLPPEFDLRAEIGTLPSARLSDAREVVWLESARDQPSVRRRGTGAGTRDLDLGGPQPLDDPILNLMERLRPHFDLLKAVRFAHQGD
jgi:hypothetical protein